jgi:hypothetical protein
MRVSDVFFKVLHQKRHKHESTLRESDRHVAFQAVLRPIVVGDCARDNSGGQTRRRPAGSDVSQRALDLRVAPGGILLLPCHSDDELLDFREHATTARRPRHVRAFLGDELTMPPKKRVWRHAGTPRACARAGGSITAGVFGVHRRSAELWDTTGRVSVSDVLVNTRNQTTSPWHSLRLLDLPTR